jgi:hypothetical protein
MVASGSKKRKRSLFQRQGHLELITGDAGLTPASSSKNQLATTIKVNSGSHRTRLGRAGDTASIGIKPNSGISPNSTKETTKLDLLLTVELRAPSPSLPQPAAPAAEIRSRAGPRSGVLRSPPFSLLSNRGERERRESYILSCLADINMNKPDIWDKVCHGFMVKCLLSFRQKK